MKDVSYTERILRSYADKPDASIGSLIKAVTKIGRLDAYTALQKDLEEIAKEYGGLSQNDDSGFSSVDTESGNDPHSRMVYPDASKIGQWWKKGLPFTLRHLESEERLREANEEDQPKILEPTRERHVEENRLQGALISRGGPTSADVTRPNEPSCKVLITFAEDGKSLAKGITSILRAPDGKRPRIGVLLLDEHWDKVQRNPEEFIMHWFRKVNYVIPILTEGYLELIRKKPNSSSDSTGSSLDVEYVPYIKDLANKYYTANSCLNNKIRCVVPLNKRSVLNHIRCKVDPLMKAYVYDTEIEKLARRMTETFDT